MFCDLMRFLTHTNLDRLSAGGKAKPLKAAKKEKKDLDEEDLAFKERQRAGKSNQARFQDLIMP
jgi:hypothetical protein